jgi:hypothetical protein
MSPTSDFAKVLIWSYSKRGRHCVVGERLSGRSEVGSDRTGASKSEMPKSSKALDTRVISRTRLPSRVERATSHVRS